jgi:hypothetical protein
MLYSRKIELGAQLETRIFLQHSRKKALKSFKNSENLKLSNLQHKSTASLKFAARSIKSPRFSRIA